MCHKIQSLYIMKYNIVIDEVKQKHFKIGDDINGKSIC